MNPPHMNGLRDGIVLLGYTGGWSAGRHLPERAAYALFRRIADEAWRRRGLSVQRLEANLSRALGTTDETAVREASRAGMRSYLRYWCEAFRLPDWDRQRIVEHIRIEGEHNMREPLAAGRGAVSALPHMANWDHGGAVACPTGAQGAARGDRRFPRPVRRQGRRPRQRRKSRADLARARRAGADAVPRGCRRDRARPHRR